MDRNASDEEIIQAFDQDESGTFECVGPDEVAARYNDINGTEYVRFIDIEE